MKGISINGEKLHEVRMLMNPHSPGTVSYLSYPKNRIQFDVIEDELILSIPPLLALELYRKGGIPQDENMGFPIQVSGKKIGVFFVVDVRYPNSHSRDSVTFTMRKQ